MGPTSRIIIAINRLGRPLQDASGQKKSQFYVNSEKLGVGAPLAGALFICPLFICPALATVFFRSFLFDLKGIYPPGLPGSRRGCLYRILS